MWFSSPGGAWGDLCMQCCPDACYVKNISMIGNWMQVFNIWTGFFTLRPSGAYFAFPISLLPMFRHSVALFLTGIYAIMLRLTGVYLSWPEFMLQCYASLEFIFPDLNLCYQRFAPLQLVKPDLNFMLPTFRPAGAYLAWLEFILKMLRSAGAYISRPDVALNDNYEWNF